MKTKIFIMTHKKFDLPHQENYVPMLVGSVFHEDDFGYLRDDTGDNISEKNRNYSELTGLYWLWKNEKDCDALGLCHYRRFFEGADQRLIKTSEAEKYLMTSDLIVPPLETIEETLVVQYDAHHHKEDRIALENAIEKVAPEYLETYREVMEGHNIYACNMFIAKRKVMDDYCSFLFPVLFETEKNLDISSYDPYSARVYGFLSERLLLVFIKKHGLKVKEVSEGVNSEKCETADAIAELSKFIEKDDWENAKAAADKVRQERPDAFFVEADTNERLTSLARAAEIRVLERKCGIGESVFDTRDARAVIEENARLKKAVKDAALEGKNIEVFLDPKVSYIAFKVFLDNDDDIPVLSRMKLAAAIAELFAKKGDMKSAGLFANAAIEYQSQL